MDMMLDDLWSSIPEEREFLNNLPDEIKTMIAFIIDYNKDVRRVGTSLLSKEKTDESLGNLLKTADQHRMRRLELSKELTECINNIIHIEEEKKTCIGTERYDELDGDLGEYLLNEARLKSEIDFCYREIVHLERTIKDQLFRRPRIEEMESKIQALEEQRKMVGEVYQTLCAYFENRTQISRQFQATVTSYNGPDRTESYGNTNARNILVETFLNDLYRQIEFVGMRLDYSGSMLDDIKDNFFDDEKFERELLVMDRASWAAFKSMEYRNVISWFLENRNKKQQAKIKMLSAFPEEIMDMIMKAMRGEITEKEMVEFHSHTNNVMYDKIYGMDNNAFRVVLHGPGGETFDAMKEMNNAFFEIANAYLPKYSISNDQEGPTLK